MNIFPKQRNFINRKAIFFFATQNKNETVSLNAKDKIPRGLNSYDLSRTDNIANNASNVNNTDAKFSHDVNMDSRRNFSNALSKAEFRRFYSILDNKKMEE